MPFYTNRQAISSTAWIVTVYSSGVNLPHASPRGGWKSTEAAVLEGPTGFCCCDSVSCCMNLGESIRELKYV
jgi:hypothetical protein